MEDLRDDLVRSRMRLHFSQFSDSRKRGAGFSKGVLFLVLSGFSAASIRAEETPYPEDPPALPFTLTAGEKANLATERELTFPVRQIRVRGSTLLSAEEIADAIYPYLGLGRTLDDLEKARTALEKAYRDKGFQTVAVELPQQNGTRGIIYMTAVESPVGRLRVRGAKYFLPSQIQKHAPSLAEGTVPDFAEVQEDIIDLNTWADRKITPSLNPGVRPGTVDVDLTVEDKLPLHGSIEVNNRYSPDTTPLRVNASINYNNLWQRGHSLGFSTQVAPERIEDAEIYSAYYIARFARAPNFSLMLLGTLQNSDVSTLGGAAVAGRGNTSGIRALFTLPGRKFEGGSYFHSLGAGMDHKQFDEDVDFAGTTLETPIEYLPFSLSYSGGWIREDSFTELNASANWHFRGMGSEPPAFDRKRFEADGAFFYFRGDVSHTHDLDSGFQLFGKVQAQASMDSLVNSEQFAGGGTSTVRGYLESEALGDKGWFVTTEVRTPSLLKSTTETEGGEAEREWRFHAFWDGGRLYLNDPLPEQTDLFRLSSWGVGTRVTLRKNVEGAVEVAWPLQDQSSTQANDPFVTFRVEAGF